MKIGILTFHHTANYGAVLQSFALSTFIRSLGHDVEIIDYRPREAEEFYWNNMRFLKLFPPYRTPKFGLIDFDALERYIKFWKFQIFFKRYLPLSKPCLKSKEELLTLKSQYDLVICGSDQIWSLNSYFRKFDTSFFLDFVDTETTQLASYAASFGSTYDLGERAHLIYPLINRLNFISVRDLNSFNLIKQLCGRDSHIVLDPTFLVAYDDLIVNPHLGEKYLVLYLQSSPSKIEEDAIVKIAHQFGLKIVSAGHFSPIADKCLINLDPREWLGLLKNSTVVITDTFHGTIFSLIFKRQFMILNIPEKSNKIDYLLDAFALKDRHLKAEEFISENVSIPVINYDLIWEKINTQIESSKCFISQVLLKSQS